MVAQANLLDIAESYLRESVAPLANEIDSDSSLLQKALKGLGDLNLLALRVPKSWAGSEASEQTFDNFQQLVARYSGALAFVQTQHQSATAMLSASHNSCLQWEYLPRISKGQLLLGVAFSQLRRECNPPLKAVRVPGGYQLEGKIPWITGFGMFHEFIVAATLPDGRAVFGVMPFAETHQAAGGTLTFCTPAQLCAMTSTNTVSATLTNWFLPQEQVVALKAASWIHENDKNSVLRPTALALGCAQAGLDIVEAALVTKPLPFICQAFESLNQELACCQTAIREAKNYSGKSLEERLQIRAWAIDLAVRCAHAAVTVSCGAANYSHHAAQRVYREALVFTVSGQTTAVMEATLSRLVRSAN